MNRSTKLAGYAIGAALGLCACSQTAQPATATIPKVQLDGDTRACHGHFNLSKLSLDWTAPRLHCSAKSPHVLAQDGSSWTFQLAHAEGCPYEIIKLINVSQRDGLPRTDYPLWLVDGFSSLEAFHGQPAKPAISCNMQ